VSDLSLFTIRDAIIGLALNGDHFVVQSSGATGSCAYSVRPKRSTWPPSNGQTVNTTIAPFLQTPGAAFLLGLAGDVSALAMAPPVGQLIEVSQQAKRTNIAVVYVGPRHEDQLAIPWERTSTSFREFVSSMGTFVDDADRVVTWQSHYHRVVFEVAPLLPLVVSNQDRTRIQNLRVAIVWVDQNLFPPLDFFSENTAVAVFVQPTDSALFIRIAVMKRCQGMAFGLIDQPIVVSRSFVPFVVTWTAIFAATKIDDAGALDGETEALRRILWEQIPRGVPMPFTVSD
jgi:hypothetical protein